MICDGKKKKDDAEEIDHVSRVDYSAANAPVMKVDTDHFNIEIGTTR